MTERSEFEPTPERATVDYESYRKVVDALSPAFRKVGLVDAAGYDRAMRDPRTLRLAIGDVELPLLAPLEHVSGYDVPRTQRLTGQQEVFVMALPLATLTAPDTKVLSEQSEFRPDGSAIVVETDHAETPEAQVVLADLFGDVGDYQPRQFLDERIKNPEQQSAMMAMYEARFEAVDESNQPKPPTGQDFFAAYEALRMAGHPSTQHSRLIHVDELRDNEALMEELWELFSDRFDWLGDSHPVSMEETKNFFVQMATNDDTHTIVRYDETGKPVCLGFFMSGLDECSWLKQDFCDATVASAAQRDEEVLYFFGIAGKVEASAHYSQDVMRLVARTAQQRGGAYRLLFESTNMSSRYIPRLVAQYTSSGHGVAMTEPIGKVAQVDYWYLTPDASAR